MDLDSAHNNDGGGGCGNGDNNSSSNKPTFSCHQSDLQTDSSQLASHGKQNKSRKLDRLRSFYSRISTANSRNKLLPKEHLKDKDQQPAKTMLSDNPALRVTTEENFEENESRTDSSQKKGNSSSEAAAKAKLPLYERSGWQLFAICYLVGVQSSLTTGFVNSCYSTLEKLFNFNSKFTGLIEGSFHVAIVLLVIPVSFYGRKGNKSLIMAGGAALIAVGAFCYSSAEFFRDQPFSVLNVTQSKTSAGFQDKSGCITNAAGTSDREQGVESTWVKWLFVTGMFLIGVGSTPIQTVAIAYLDQGSKHGENTGWSLGWFHAVGLLAPALGFVLSGSFLSMPIDFSSWGMSTEDDSFMGAWWMGFMLECALALILVPILLTLPNTASDSSHPAIPATSEAAETVKEGKACNSEDKSSSSKTVAKMSVDLKKSRATQARYDKRQQQKQDMNEFWLCLKCLMKDKTFLCLLLHGSVLHMTTAGLTAFIPKFFETQYRMIAQIAAFVAGGVSVPAAAIGAIISGYIIKRMQLNCLGTIKMTFYAQGTCILLCTVFFIIRCPYGHVYMLDELEMFKEDSGIPTSEGFCDGSEMQIHCVNNQFNIYSPCLLKCEQEGHSCSQRNVTLEFGLCEPGQCHWRVPAFTIFFITFLVASMVAVPRIFALLRLVQDDWKTISLGIQWVFFRLLGMIPGPLVYGQIFDSACTQWGSFSMTCSNAHSTGHCSFYNSTTLRNYMIVVTVGSLIIGELCLYFAIRFYEKEHQGPHKKGYICAPEHQDLITLVYVRDTGEDPGMKQHMGCDLAQETGKNLNSNDKGQDRKEDKVELEANGSETA